MATVEVKLDRTDRIYHSGESICGLVHVNAPGGTTHTGVKVTVTGNVLFQLSPRAVGMLEALYTTIKPIQLLSKSVELAPAGKIVESVAEFPFEVPVEAGGDGSIAELLETYHGAYINIQYLVTAEVARGILMKALTSSTEFIIEGRTVVSRGSTKHAEKTVNFVLSSEMDTQQRSENSSALGSFRVTGSVATRCGLTQPLLGEIRIERSSLPINSVDVQVLRVETVRLGDKSAKETTQVQSTQVADGDVCRGLLLPIYVVLPRLFTCPTFVDQAFSVEFEVSVRISFYNGRNEPYLQYDTDAGKELVASDTFPLKLSR